MINLDAPLASKKIPKVLLLMLYATKVCYFNKKVRWSNGQKRWFSQLDRILEQTKLGAFH